MHVLHSHSRATEKILLVLHMLHMDTQHSNFCVTMIVRTQSWNIKVSNQHYVAESECLAHLS